VIRRTPIEFFLKYLIVHPDEFTNDAIKERLFELGLDDLGEYYIDRLRAKVKPPKPFYPGDKHHQRSQRFLITEGIQDLFFPNNDTVTAYRILDFPRIKEFVESMLIAYAPVEAIALSMTRHRNFPATPRAIEIFKLYFWNVDLLDSVGMRALLKMRPGAAAAHSSKDIQRQAEPLKASSWNDPRRVVSELPFSPLSATMAQVRMGLMPKGMNLGSVLTTAREMAAMGVVESICTNGARDHMKARDLAEIVRLTTEVLEVVVKPDETMRDQLAHIAMRTDDKPVPFVHSLSEGKHTVDMQPMPKGNDDGYDGDAAEVPGVGGEGGQPVG
jgi:hypothetical protein